jgi:hypothetical protein
MEPTRERMGVRCFDLGQAFAWATLLLGAACGSSSTGASPFSPPTERKDAGSDDAAAPDAADAAPEAPLPPLLRPEDIPNVFHVSGTQIGDVPRGNHWESAYCSACHRTGSSGPYDGWSGSLMSQAGRDPLFFAQLATANQDVPGVGYYCLRCHVPVSIITGHAYEPTGARLDAFDRDGVTCHLCHTLIDPIGERGDTWQDGQDTLALERLKDRPAHYGNAMFAIQPGGQRRGPYTEASVIAGGVLAHEVSYADFIERADICGTCHDVGNPAIVRGDNGVYRLGDLQSPTRDPDPAHQFPLERTYTEWRLSDFATDEGVDLGGKFGTEEEPAVGKCHDCHMPNTTGNAANIGQPRSDLDQHDFAGAATWPLEIIGLRHRGDPAVDQDALKRGQDRALSMLKRATSLQVDLTARSLHVRVVNDCGHKFPTGHIEGRRGWVNVVFRNRDGASIAEAGAYRTSDGSLDEKSTMVFEMKVGLSPEAAARSGLPEGVTTHMSLADTIVKDTRIPPRGFDRARFEAEGAGAVAADYADGQYWAEMRFDAPNDAASAIVTVYYQMMTHEYVEALDRGNHTNGWGEILYDLWKRTDQAPPVAIAEQTLPIPP